MAPDLPSPARPKLSRKLVAWGRRLRLPRGPWAYILVALALAAASEILWLWHSWPVREILQTEHAASGASL